MALLNVKSVSAGIAGTGLVTYLLGIPSKGSSSGSTNTSYPSGSNNGLSKPDGPNNIQFHESQINPSEYFKIGGFPGPIFDLAQSKQFITCYDRERKIPKWVVEHVTRESLDVKNGDRKKSNFKEDQRIPTTYRSLLKDYFRSGYDRGHMAPAADSKFDQVAMDQTFLLTNMAPQVGEGFNRDYWSHFECFVRDLCVKDFESVRIITGPLFLPKFNEQTKKYEIKYEVIGNPPSISVPTHFYKIVVAENFAKDNNRNKVENVYVAGFVLPNDKIPNDIPLTYFKTPIEAIERSSGLSFFQQNISNKKVNDLCDNVSCVLTIRDWSQKVKAISPPK